MSYTRKYLNESSVMIFRAGQESHACYSIKAYYSNIYSLFY